MKSGLPAIDPKIDSKTRVLLEGLKEVAEVGEGKRGNVMQRNIKLRDLLDLGLVKIIGGLRGGVVGSDLQPTIKPPSLSIPPAPTGFEVTGGFSNIFLQWDDPQSLYDNHSHTIIYRNTEDNVADAQPIAQVAVGMLYADSDVSYSAEYFYWIRFVSAADVQGPFNSSTGTAGKISEDPAELLKRLRNKITESELYDVLNSRINLIDAPGTGLVTRVSSLQTETSSIATNISQLTSVLNDQTVIVETSAAAIDGIKGQYTVKIDNNGVMSGYGLSSETVNGQVNSYFLVNANTFAIVNSGNSKIVSSLSRSGTTATANCVGHGHAPGDRITISNVYESAWNGSWQVATVLDANSFTFSVPGTIPSAATARVRINGKALLSLTRLGTTASAIFLTAHGLKAGATIDVSNANETGWSGQYQVATVPSANTMTFAVSTGLASTATASIKTAAQTIPFVVDGGKVVMDGAFIKSLSVTSASIGIAAVDSIHVKEGSIIESKLENASVTNLKIGNVIHSTNYVPGLSGWYWNKLGNVEAYNIYARGDIRASSLQAGTAMVDTLNVNGEAITAVRYGEGASGTLNSGNQITAVALPSMSLPPTLSGVLLTANVSTVATGSRCNVFVEFLRNGTLIKSCNGGALEDQPTANMFNYFDASPGTNPSYSLRLRAGPNSGGNGAGDYAYYTPSLTAHGAKR